MRRLLGLAFVFVSSSIGAQPSDIGMPPQLQCYMDARSTGIAMVDAKELCIGSTSPETARCFADALALRFLTDAQSKQLCIGAMSIGPVECAARLRATSGLVTSDIVSFCAALQYPFITPGNGGVPECIDLGQSTGLSDSQVLSLCQGSTSSQPARCVAQGRGLTGLVDSDLVDLCRQVVPYPAYGGSTTPNYGGMGTTQYPGYGGAPRVPNAPVTPNAPVLPNVPVVPPGY